MSGAISQVAKVTSTIKHLRFGDEHLGELVDHYKE